MSSDDNEHEFDETIDRDLLQNVEPAEARSEGPAGDPIASTDSSTDASTDISTRYQLGERLGSGGMAIVFEANDSNLKRTVAVKILRTELAARPEARSRFFAEAQIMGALDHPGVIPVFEVGTLQGGEAFYAMKKVHGITLKDMLDQRPDVDISSRPVMMHLVNHFERVCQTVAAAHAKNIIHRDLKPANVMIDDLEQVYVLDWGLAKCLDRVEGADTSRTRYGALMGTPAYMSPEQASGNAAESDCQSDVFSLGVMFYEILTGVQAFAASDSIKTLKGVQYHDPRPPMKVNPRVGRELSAVCMKALVKDPFERYSSAGEMAEDLCRFCEFRPVMAIKPRVIDHVGKWIRRNTTLAAVLGTLILAVLVAGFGIGLQAATESHMVAGAYERIDQAEAEIQRLNSEIVDIYKEIKAATTEDQRDRLEKQLIVLEAELEVHHGAVVSLATAITGFTLFSPEERARKIMHDNALSKIGFLITTEDWARARIELAYVLSMAEGRNLFGFNDEDIRWLKQQRIEVETRIEADNTR